MSMWVLRRTLNKSVKLKEYINAVEIIINLKSNKKLHKGSTEKFVERYQVGNTALIVRAFSATMADNNKHG